MVDLRLTNSVKCSVGPARCCPSLYFFFPQLFYFQSNPSELFQLLNLTFLNVMFIATLALLVLDIRYLLPTVGREDLTFFLLFPKSPPPIFTV